MAEKSKATINAELSPRTSARLKNQQRDRVRSINTAMVSDDDNSLLGILGDDFSPAAKRQSRIQQDIPKEAGNAVKSSDSGQNPQAITSPQQQQQQAKPAAKTEVPPSNAADVRAAALAVLQKAKQRIADEESSEEEDDDEEEETSEEDDDEEEEESSEGEYETSSEEEESSEGEYETTSEEEEDDDDDEDEEDDDESNEVAVPKKALPNASVPVKPSSSEPVGKVKLEVPSIPDKAEPAVSAQHEPVKVTDEDEVTKSLPEETVGSPPIETTDVESPIDEQSEEPPLSEEQESHQDQPEETVSSPSAKAIATETTPDGDNNEESQDLSQQHSEPNTEAAESEEPTVDTPPSEATPAIISPNDNELDQGDGDAKTSNETADDGAVSQSNDEPSVSPEDNELDRETDETAADDAPSPSESNHEPSVSPEEEEPEHTVEDPKEIPETVADEPLSSAGNDKTISPEDKEEAKDGKVEDTNESVGDESFSPEGNKKAISHEDEELEQGDQVKEANESAVGGAPSLTENTESPATPNDTESEQDDEVKEANETVSDEAPSLSENNNESSDAPKESEQDDEVKEANETVSDGAPSLSENHNESSDAPKESEQDDEEPQQDVGSVKDTNETVSDDAPSQLESADNLSLSHNYTESEQDQEAKETKETVNNEASFSVESTDNPPDSPEDKESEQDDQVKETEVAVNEEATSPSEINIKASVETEEPDDSEVNENDSESQGEEGSDEEEDEGESSEEESEEEATGHQNSRPRASIPANVESIEIAAEARSIPPSAFENCEQLKFVTFPADSQVHSIGDAAFFKCESLLEMHFPQHLEVIADEAFLGCVELRKALFTSPETLQRIGKYAFYGCKELLEIGLPDDFDRIGRNAFYGCFKLLRFPKSSDPNVFVYTGEDDNEFDVPEDVTHVRIGNNCEVIPKKTFMYRHQLIQVDFRNADNLKTIEKHAFYRCDNLRDVNLSFTPLQSIGQKAFFGCKSLTSISPPKTLMLVDSDALNFSGYYLYKGESGEMVPIDMKQVRIGPNVTSLPKEAFVQCEKLLEVMFVDALRLTSIGEEAFYYSEALAEISLPKNLRYIERAAFLGCTGLATVSFNDKLEIIGDEAFEACTSLKSVALTENVRVIGDSAFYACAKLATVQVNDQLKVIGREAFMMCKSLGNITLPSGLNSLGENAFDQCANLEWIDLSGPDNLPLAMHIRVKNEDEAGERLKMASLVKMYSESPIDSSKLMSDSEEELQLLDEIKAAYLLIELDNIATVLNREKDNGFVQFLAHHVDEQSAETLVGFLRASSMDVVQRLAVAKDYSGNSALQVARPPVLQAFQERLMFLGRYHLEEEPIVRKSDNAIVIEALDYKMEEYYERGFDRWSLAETLDDELFCRALEDLLLIPLENSSAVSKEYFQKVELTSDGEITKDAFLSFCTEQFGRKVVLKFMLYEDQYQRELQRNSLDLDRKYVLRIFRHHDKRDTPEMAEALPGFIGAHVSEGESPLDYGHLLVLPLGDRNLEAIYRHEKPDRLETKSMLREVGNALSHLHDNGLVHGNLRMSKIIRQIGHYKLSDMASSARIGQEPLGLKVSSGVLPPEMIHGILSKSGCKQLEEYYKNASLKMKGSRAPKISYMPTQLWCVTRAFLTDKDEKSGLFAPRTEGLPYKLLQASASADVWSFGILVYACCTGNSLFKVNYRDSIEDGNSLRVLWDWNDLDLEAALEEGVDEDAARDLLRSILQREASRRPSMKEILRHPFFDPDIKIHDWQSTSTAPTATPHHDYVTALNDELETPLMQNKRTVSSSRLKSAFSVSNYSGEEETVSLLEYNELSQEVESLRAEPKKKPMVSSARSEEDSVSMSEYRKLMDERSHLKDKLKESRQKITTDQTQTLQLTAPRPNTFQDIEILCEGWLQKRRQDKRSLWKNRYFVSYEDGTVTYFQNASYLNDQTKGGCTFHMARFRKPNEESLDTFELQTHRGDFIMHLRLSPFTICKVEDWLGAKQRKDNSVVHKGWLQKQSRKYKHLWNERYFLLSKTGSVMYYGSASDANNPSVGGVTFARVKWEHVADTMKKEDFELKTISGDLIMKVRLSKLSPSSIDDWMRGNEWFEKPKHSSSPTGNEDNGDHFEPVARSGGPNSVVYENDVATFSGISEMGYTYDEIRLSGNIAVPSEVVSTMEVIQEKKESTGKGEIANDIGDSLPDELTEEPNDINDVGDALPFEFTEGPNDAVATRENHDAENGPQKKRGWAAEESDRREIVDELGDELPDEDDDFVKEPNRTDFLHEEQGATEKQEDSKGITLVEEFGSRQIGDELSGAFATEEEAEIPEEPNDPSVPLETKGAESDPREKLVGTEEYFGDREVVAELGDALPDEDENEIKVIPDDIRLPNEVKTEEGDGGAGEPMEQELLQVAEEETENTGVVETEKGIEDSPNDEIISTEGGGNEVQQDDMQLKGVSEDAISTIPDAEEKDGVDLTNSNSELIQSAEGGAKDTDCIQGTPADKPATGRISKTLQLLKKKITRGEPKKADGAPNDGVIANESTDADIPAVNEGNQAEGKPENAITTTPDAEEKDGEDITKENGVVQNAEEETKDVDDHHDTAAGKHGTGRMSKTLQLLKQKVGKGEPKKADDTMEDGVIADDAETQPGKEAPKKADDAPNDGAIADNVDAPPAKEEKKMQSGTENVAATVPAEEKDIPKNINDVVQPAKEESKDTDAADTNGNTGMSKTFQVLTRKVGKQKYAGDAMNEGSVPDDSCEDIIPPVKDKKQATREPKNVSATIPKAEGTSGGAIPSEMDQAAQEETQDNDVVGETPTDKDAASGISRAFKLFKRKVVREEPDDGDEIEQLEYNDISTGDQDQHDSYYDYNSLPDRFDGHARPNHLASTVNFAGEVSYTSDNEVSLSPKPDATEMSTEEHPSEGHRGKSMARKFGEKIPKLVTQLTDRLEQETKARSRKRREKLKQKKRMRALSFESDASDAILHA